MASSGSAAAAPNTEALAALVETLLRAHPQASADLKQAAQALSGISSCSSVLMMFNGAPLCSDTCSVACPLAQTAVCRGGKPLAGSCQCARQPRCMCETTSQGALEPDF
jgi:hypothetical protein